MKFNYDNIQINVDIANNNIVKDKRPAVLLDDLFVVQTNSAKLKFRPEIEVNTDRKRKYALRYYLINQDAKVLNFANPIVKHADAVKLMRSLINMDNTIIYVVPMKIVIGGGKFTVKGTLKKNKKMPTFVLATTV